MAFLKKIIVGILAFESRLILAKYKPFIIAVTGSVGKTSTKDAIYHVLTSPGVCHDGTGICFVRRSEKSMNSEIGLPLTVIGAPNAWHSIAGWFQNIVAGLKLIVKRSEYPDCLILEVGADHPGDIKRVVKWLKPDIAVITRVSATPVHVEFFKSPQEVFEEKAALAHAVKKGGTLVLFADEEKVSSLASLEKEKGIQVITFGMNEKADIKGLQYSVLYDDANPVGISFDLQMDGTNTPITVKGIVGQVYLYPLLAAAAVGKARGVDSNDIVQGLKRYEAPRGRMNLIPGVNGSAIIDDTYNSSPDAAVSALATLKGLQFSAGRKVAILGDMMELGKYSAEEHRKVGHEAASSAAMLVTVGPRSRATAEEALKQGMAADAVHAFDTAEEAAAYVKPQVRAGDIILVKGSQSMRMERVARALLREPEKAEKLLVRQEREWLGKK